jgi:hypothetical protein
MQQKSLIDFGQRLQDSEEVFPLRGQDASAPKLVMLWIAENLHCSDEKLRDAFECALRMRKTEFIKPAD